MTQTLDLPLPDSRTSEHKLVLGVCFAHFVSHYYITLLAPLFVFIKEDYAVSYTDLGLAFTAFNVASTLFQTPTGFLVDRADARFVIIAGLVVGAAAFAIAGVVNSFWVFVAMFAVAGIGNTVYHPANYTLLARHVPAERVGRVFSYHTFSGMIGNAAAPPTLVFMYAFVGWRGAFLAAAALGVVSAIALLFLREPAPVEPAPGQHADGKRQDGAAGTGGDGWGLLM